MSAVFIIFVIYFKLKSMSKSRKIKTRKSQKGSYKEPHPMSERRRFWEYDLNPITGMGVPTVIQKKQKTYN